MFLQIGLDYIRPELMESFLNDKCLSSPITHMEDIDAGPYYEHPNFTISSNFLFLCPNSEQLGQNIGKKLEIPNG